MEPNDDSLVRVASLELKFLIDENQSSGSVVMFEFNVPSAARVPAPHFHKEVDEVVYGLEGTLTATLEGAKREIRPGESLFVPRGSVHMFENLHADPARALVVLTPGSIGRRYFEEMAAALNGPGKPEPTLIHEIMLRHGLIPA